jgi:hypothetical protein
MKSALKYLEEKYPKIFEEYQQYKKVESAKEKKAAAEKAKKEKEEAIKHRGRFDKYYFNYEYFTSYKGWTEGPHYGDMPFHEAFERIENMHIDPEGKEGMSFKEYLEYGCYSESEFFEKWFDLFDGKDDDLLGEISNCDVRVEEAPTYSGTYYYTKNEIKDFFRKATYKDLE